MYQISNYYELEIQATAICPAVRVVVGPGDNGDPDYVAGLLNITTSVNPKSDTEGSSPGGIDGVVSADVWWAERIITFELSMIETDIGNRAGKLNMFFALASNIRNVVKLRWQEADGIHKAVTVKLASSPILGHNVGPVKNITLNLQADDPYIYSDPIMNQTQSAVQIEDDEEAVNISNTITNIGNAPCYPRFYLYGPYTNVTLTNTLTGASLVINKDVAEGEYIYVDTRQLTRAVLGNGINQLYGYVDVDNPNHDWDGLVGAPGLPGQNVFTTYTMTGADIAFPAKLDIRWDHTYMM